MQGSLLPALPLTSSAGFPPARPPPLPLLPISPLLLCVDSPSRPNTSHCQLCDHVLPNVLFDRRAVFAPGRFSLYIATSGRAQSPRPLAHHTHVRHVGPHYHVQSCSAAGGCGPRAAHCRRQGGQRDRRSGREQQRCRRRCYGRRRHHNDSCLWEQPAPLSPPPPPPAAGAAPQPAGLLPSLRPSHGDGARRRWRSRVAHPLRSLLVSVTDGDDDHRRPQRPDLH